MEKQPMKIKIRRAGRNRKQFRAVLVGRNGEKVWWTETYKTKAKAQKAIALLQNIDFNNIQDLT